MLVGGWMEDEWGLLTFFAASFLLPALGLFAVLGVGGAGCCDGLLGCVPAAGAGGGGILVLPCRGVP